MLVKVHETIVENGQEIRRVRLINPDHISDVTVIDDEVHIFMSRGLDILVKNAGDIAEFKYSEELSRIMELFPEWQKKEDEYYDRMAKNYEEMTEYNHYKGVRL